MSDIATTLETVPTKWEIIWQSPTLVVHRFPFIAANFLHALSLPASVHNLTPFKLANVRPMHCFVVNMIQRLNVGETVDMERYVLYMQSMYIYVEFEYDQNPMCSARKR